MRGSIYPKNMPKCWPCSRDDRGLRWGSDARTLRLLLIPHHSNRSKSLHSAVAPRSSVARFRPSFVSKSQIGRQARTKLLQCLSSGIGLPLTYVIALFAVAILAQKLQVADCICSALRKRDDMIELKVLPTSAGHTSPLISSPHFPFHLFGN
jgi:hypothetical protein